MAKESKIKIRRIELGLTLRDVANALGTAESTISRYETGNIQNMGIDKLVALSRVLKCSMDYLLDISDTIYSSLSDHSILENIKTDDYTEEEIDKIKEYAKFLKMNRYPNINDNSSHFTDIEKAKNYLKQHKMFAAFNGKNQYSDDTILQIANAIYKEKGNPQ